MSDDHRGSGGGGGALFVILIVVGFVVKYAVWIGLFLGAVLVIGGMVLRSMYLDRRDEERQAADAEIVARADQQHADILAGYDRGVYGEWPPYV